MQYIRMHTKIKRATKFTRTIMQAHAHSSGDHGCKHVHTHRQQTYLSFPGPFEPVRGDKYPLALERVVPHVRVLRGTEDSRQRLRLRH